MRQHASRWVAKVEAGATIRIADRRIPTAPAIIALPTDMFDNTGIATYIWILDSNQPTKRKDKIQLVNAVEIYGKMRKSLGSKRKELRVLVGEIQAMLAEVGA